MKRALVLFLLLLATGVGAQGQATQVVSGPTDPAFCNPNVGLIFFNTTSLTFRTCVGVNTWGPFGGGTPGSPSTSVQYNNGGVFGGDSSFEFNNAQKTMGVGVGFGDGTLASDIGYSSSAASPYSLLVGTHATDTVNASSHFPAGGGIGAEYTGSAVLTNSNLTGLNIQALHKPTGSGSIQSIFGLNSFAYNQVGTVTEVNGGLHSVENDGTVTHLVSLEAGGGFNLGTVTGTLRSLNVTGFSNSGTVSAAEVAGIYLQDVSLTGALNNYALHILNQAATGAFAIKTGTGLVSFGGATSAPTLTLNNAADPSGFVYTTVNGSAGALKAPGLPDGNGGNAVTTTPYSILCDSGTTTRDRTTTIRFQSGASVVNLPDHTLSGCGSNMSFRLIDDGAGLLTVNAGGADTLTITDGSTDIQGATSFTMTTGNFATINNGAGGIWEVANVKSSGLSGSAVIRMTDYGVVADTKLQTSCTWSNTQTPVTVTCAASDIPFASSDTGKSCVGPYSPNPTIGTFTFISATSGTCSATSTNAAAGTGHFVVGTDSSAAALAAWNALLAFPRCGTLILPTGVWWNSHALSNNSINCSVGPAPGESGGLTVKSANSGAYTSIMFMPPNFDFSCPTGCMYGTLSNQVNLEDFSITGANLSMSGKTCGSGTNYMFSAQTNLRMKNVGLNYGFNNCSNNFDALFLSGGAQGAVIYGFTQFDTFGTPGRVVVGGTPDVLFEDFCCSPLQLNNNSTVKSINSFWGQYATGNVAAVLINSGATFWTNFDEIGLNGSQSSIVIDNTGSIRWNGSTASNNSSATYNLYNRTGAGTIDLQNAFLSGGSTNTIGCDAGAGSIVDRGNNTVGTVKATCTNIVGEAQRNIATAVTAAKTVLSAGWGTTATSTALTGYNAPIQFTITNSGTGQGASPTITYTFPIAYLVTPFTCTATQTGGTNAVGTFTSSALSTTGVTFTFSLTPTAASTEIVQVTCVVP